MAESKSDGLLGGLIIGAALGAIAGVLAAPRPGKDTRRILRKSADALPELAEDLATSIQFQADRLSDTTLSNWDKTLERLREAVSAGQAASRREWKRQQPNYSSDYSTPFSNGDGVPSLTEDE
jgi:gas vesicle protein